MRYLLPLVSFALLGCGGSDDAAFAPVPVSSSTTTSSTSTTTTTGSGGMGGDGGGSTVASTSSAGGTGGMGGAGSGQGGDGGQGGDCVPDPSPCDTMPDSTCGGWTNSCGDAIECGDEACSGLPCDVFLSACVCGDASSYGVAVNKCNNAGPGLSPWFCGSDPQNPDVPAGCTITDLITFNETVWCCPN